jgi:hypothetical protein
MDSYKKMIALYPDDPAAHYNLGLTYLNLGDKKSALQEHETLKKIDSKTARQLLDLINNK